MNVSYLMDPKEQQEAADAAREAELAHDQRQLNWVNVYELDRHSGGPEEGGWWYDSAEVIAAIPLHDLIEADASNLVELMKMVYPEPKSGSRESRYCSIYSGGDYQVLREEQRGQSWPTERPRYE